MNEVAKVQLIIPLVTLQNEVIEMEVVGVIPDKDVQKLTSSIVKIDRPQIKVLEDEK